MRPALPRWCGVALVMLTTVSCGAGATGPVPDPSSAEATTPATVATPDDDPPLATLALVDLAADHRPPTADDWSAATDGQSLEQGEGVRTDQTGFAIVAYRDGTTTRLDLGTQFTVQVLDDDAAAPEVRVRLDLGGVWNDLRDLDGSFVLETDVGTAAVRGTVFWAECQTRTLCFFGVVEGEIELTPVDGAAVALGPGEAVIVTRRADGVLFVGEPQPEDATGSDQHRAFRQRVLAVDAGEEDPGSTVDAPPPVVVLEVALGEQARVGDRLALSRVFEGQVFAPDDRCPAWHLRPAPGADGIRLVGGTGPFVAPLDGCGYGTVLHQESEGPTGRQFEFNGTFDEAPGQERVGDIGP